MLWELEPLIKFNYCSLWLLPLTLHNLFGRRLRGSRGRKLRWRLASMLTIPIDNESNFFVKFYSLLVLKFLLGTHGTHGSQEFYLEN